MTFGVSQNSFVRKEEFETCEQHLTPFPLLISRNDFCRKLRKYIIYEVEKYVFYYSWCKSNRHFLSFINISNYVVT